MQKKSFWIFLLLIGISHLSAQNLLKRVGKKIVKQVSEQLDTQTKPQADSQTPSESSAPGEVQPVQRGDSQPDTGQSLQSFSQYDFVPGDQILFFDDFSQDAVGDFPTLWTTTGSGEVKTLNRASGKWLHMNTMDKQYQVLRNLNLPDNYIVEFDLVVVPHEAVNPSAVVFSLYTAESEDPGIIDHNPGGVRLHIGHDQWLAESYYEGKGWIEGQSELNVVKRNEPEHVIVWVQKRRLRVYHGGEKVLDLPTILPTGFVPNRLMFDLWDTGSGTGYLSNLRITTASPDLRNKLLNEGKLISYGIYFDVNSDRVQPDSYGTLKEIASVLQEANVPVRIVGHTDSTGNDSANLELSKRRAASIKAELVKMGVDQSLLTSEGAGASQPIVPNDTPAHKALNRRSEFIRN